MLDVLSLNPGHCGDRPATNRLCYDKHYRQKMSVIFIGHLCNNGTSDYLNKYTRLCRRECTEVMQGYQDDKQAPLCRRSRARVRECVFVYTCVCVCVCEVGGWQ
jgi:hypothetical protein